MPLKEQQDLFDLMVAKQTVESLQNQLLQCQVNLAAATLKLQENSLFKTQATEQEKSYYVDFTEQAKTALKALPAMDGVVLPAKTFLNADGEVLP